MTGFACVPKNGPDSSKATSKPGDVRQSTDDKHHDNLQTFTLLLQEGKYDQVNSILEIPGKKYLLAGVTSSSEISGTDGYLVIIDEQGRKTLEKTYPLPGDQYFYSLVSAPDNGYMILGVVKTPGKEDWDLYLVKMDADLNQVWEKSFGGNGVEDCNELIRTRDGGYAFAGHTDSMGNGKYDFYVVKLDKAGSTEWEKTYGTEAPEIARAIIQTRDDGYLVAGHGGPSRQQVLVKKINSRGEEQWSRIYGDDLANYVNSITETVDGNYLLAGMRQYNVNEKQAAYSIYLLKIKGDGTKILEKNFTYEGRMVSLAQSIRRTLDGNYIIGGAVQHAEDIGLDMAVLKIDPDGKLIWKKVFTYAGGSYTNIALPVSDGGYLAGGYASRKVVQEDKGINRVLYLGRYGFVVKFNSYGEINP